MRHSYDVHYCPVIPGTADDDPAASGCSTVDVNARDIKTRAIDYEAARPMFAWQPLEIVRSSPIEHASQEVVQVPVSRFQRPPSQ